MTGDANGRSRSAWWAAPAVAVAIAAVGGGLGLSLAVNSHNSAPVPKSFTVPTTSPAARPSHHTHHHHHKTGSTHVSNPSPATVITPDRPVVTGSPEADEHGEDSRRSGRDADDGVSDG